MTRRYPIYCSCLIAILSGCGTTRPAQPARARTSAHSPDDTATTLPAFDAESVGTSFILLGLTHRPLGTVMTMAGIVADNGLWKGDEVGVPTLFVQRIDGVATEEDIRLPIPGATFDKPDWVHHDWANPDERMHLVRGQTYSICGFETGVYEGTPAGAGADRSQQTPFGFHCWFSPADPDWPSYAGPTPIAPITLGPADFIDRSALISGTAANIDHIGYLIGAGWRLRSADDGSPWPDWMVDKPAEVEGVIRSGPPGDFRAEHAQRRLVRLVDQVGHLVELHGIAHKPYPDWQLRYRGQEILIRNLAACPGWSDHQEWKPVVIRGTLTREPNQVPEDPGGVWVISDPSWAPLSSLRSPETQDPLPSL